MLLFLDTNGKWKITNANSTTTSTALLGYALNDADTDDSIDILIDGVITLIDYHRQLGGSITPGAPLYIRENNAEITQVAPSTAGDIVRLIGHNIVGDTSPSSYVVIRFKPDNTWIEL
jgi:hypothetical protein